MSKRSHRDKRKAKSTSKRHTTFASSRLTDTKFPDYRLWPVVKAYVPVEDCFRATGCGTAGVVRQAPDGKLVSSFFNIELLDGGLKNAMGKDQTDEAEIEDFLESLKYMMPPTEPGPVDLAARYIWGAYAWSRQDGFDFPEEMKARYLRVVPLLSGTQNWWLQQFIGPDGLVPPKLLEVIEDNPVPDDLPEGKEILIFSTINFDLSDPQAALEHLRGAAPEFTEVEPDGATTCFDWSRKYPRNHWSPLRLMGGRQSLGSVRVDDNTLVAESKTLTMAAVLVAKLKDMLGDRIHLRDTVWKGAAEMIREAGAKPRD